MVILALLEIPELDAADAIIEAVGNGVPVRQRLRYATQRIIATHGGVVTVRFAVLARQDRDEMERRMPGNADNVQRLTSGPKAVSLLRD